MKNDSILFIGMDTHKEFTEVAYSLDGRNNEVIHLGRIPSTKQGLLKLARQFQSKYPKATLHFLYEAGPCGYWKYRLLSQQGLNQPVFRCDKKTYPKRWLLSRGKPS